MQKFRFKLQSRSGPQVDGIVVIAVNETEALQKLYQLFPACQILETTQIPATAGIYATSVLKSPSLNALRPQRPAAERILPSGSALVNPTAKAAASANLAAASVFAASNSERGVSFQLPASRLSASAASTSFEDIVDLINS